MEGLIFGILQYINFVKEALRWIAQQHSRDYTKYIYEYFSRKAPLTSIVYLGDHVSHVHCSLWHKQCAL